MCLKLEAAETLLDRVNARGALLSSGRRVRSLDDDPDQRSRAVYDQLRRFIRKGRAHDDSATMNKMANLSS